jgi:hypothetical protein
VLEDDETGDSQINQGSKFGEPMLWLANYTQHPNKS